MLHLCALYHKRSDLGSVKPIQSQDGIFQLYQVNLTKNADTLFQSMLIFSLGEEALPLPSRNKTLKYLTLGRGVLTYECNRTILGDDQPAYVCQNVDLYDVASLAQNSQ